MRMLKKTPFEELLGEMVMQINRYGCWKILKFINKI